MTTMTHFPAGVVKGTGIRPFRSGPEYIGWCAENCDRCGNRSGCPLEASLFRAMTTLDKTIGIVLASDLGWSRTTSACPRIVPCEEVELNMRVFGKNEPYWKWRGPFDADRVPKITKMRVLGQVGSGA
jgi:hypothetical protein